MGPGPEIYKFKKTSGVVDPFIFRIHLTLPWSVMGWGESGMACTVPHWSFLR
jgi:hypothetical protein